VTGISPSKFSLIFRVSSRDLITKHWNAVAIRVEPNNLIIGLATPEF